MKRCSRCILPETYPDIRYDRNGVCNKCRDQERKYDRRDFAVMRRRLDGIFSWARKQGKRYDCIVPFSGGKDSTYTLHVCRDTYGLNVLAMNFNNGLRTIEALKNIENITKKMGIALISYGPGWDAMKGLYREFFLKTGQFCFPCDMGIWASAQRVAEHYDVPLIVSGFSAQIESRGHKIYSYNNALFRRIAGRVIREGEMDNFLARSFFEKLKGRLKRLRIGRYIRQISLPDYMPWDDAIIKETIYDRLGWEKRADGSSDHIDCEFASVKNYLVVKKWGFGEKTTKYSAMARCGQMTREEALLRAQAEESDDVSPALKSFMEVFDLQPSDIEAARNKSHLEYM